MRQTLDNAKIVRFSLSASTLRMPSSKPVSRPSRFWRAVPAFTDRRGGVWGSVIDPSVLSHCAAAIKVMQPSGQPIHEPRPSMRSDREPRVAGAAASSGRNCRSDRSSQAVIPACRARIAHRLSVFSAVPCPVFSRRFPLRSTVRFAVTGSCLAQPAGRRAAESGAAARRRGTAGRAMRRTADRVLTPTWSGVGRLALDGAGGSHE
ncbi:hypothetical protein AB4851_19235 [Burkholderia sp. 22PA0099]|uniref:hypothetical protein n=1 Tax=Burkholderia sp. 22PA0099 TaxID=3237372 RepID=UPI0039C48B51